MLRLMYIVDTTNNKVADYPIPVTDNADKKLIPVPLTVWHQQKYKYLNNDELKKEAEEVFCAIDYFGSGGQWNQISWYNI